MHRVLIAPRTKLISSVNLQLFSLKIPALLHTISILPNFFLVRWNALFYREISLFSLLVVLPTFNFILTSCSRFPTSQRWNMTLSLEYSFCSSVQAALPSFSLMSTILTCVHVGGPVTLNLDPRKIRSPRNRIFNKIRTPPSPFAHAF